MARPRVFLKRRISDHSLIALTILLSLLLFVIAPLQTTGVVSGTYFGILFGLSLIPAIVMLSDDRPADVALVISIILVITAAITEGSLTDRYLDAVAWLIAGLTLSVTVARAVFARGKVTYHRVVGGVLLFLTIGVTFVALYGLLVLLVPNPFINLRNLPGHLHSGSLIYFSFVTLTTTGYGDIVPLHPYVRGLANVEAIIGQLYPATLLARLVTLELSGGRG
jgi:Ion channel